MQYNNDDIFDDINLDEVDPDLEKLIDAKAMLQVFGCIMKNPSLLPISGLESGDMGDPFYEIVFTIINNLYLQKLNKIDIFAVESYFAYSEKGRKIFEKNDGFDYINACWEFSEPENFYAYNKIVKKYACLRKLKERGVDIRAIYNYEISDPKRKEEELLKIYKMDVDGIMNLVQRKLVSDLKIKYGDKTKQETFAAGDGLEELKEEWKKTPDFGLPFHEQKILTTIVRGARLGTVSIFSGGTGTGKTRLGYGKMCGLSIPWYYNWDKDDFEYHEGLDNPCLIIQTELTRTENQSLILAYVSGVDETIIRTGKYTSKHQEDVVNKSMEYIAQSPLYINLATDFTIEDIEETIKRYYNEYGCKYFFFDYLQLTPAIAGEMTKGSNGMRSREDIVMLFAITRLKNLANELGIYLYTSTQLNNSYKDAGNFVDQSALRSAKSLADKIDVGSIILTPSEAEIKATKEFMRKGNVVQPNIVNHIYKCRGTQFSKLKLFQKADLGTCRTYDLYCTNTNNVLIDVPVWDVEIGKKPSKTEKKLETKLEKIIDANSVGIEKTEKEELLVVMNPVKMEELVRKTEDATEEVDAELNTKSHSMLRDMGF